MGFRDGWWEHGDRGNEMTGDLIYCESSGGPKANKTVVFLALGVSVVLSLRPEGRHSQPV